MTETETLAVSTATALQQLHLQGIGNVSQTFLWHFVVNFAQQLLAIVHCQDCMLILCLFHLQGSDLHYGISGSTFVLSNHLYIPISPCSVDIGNSLEGIVTEFELTQHK